MDVIEVLEEYRISKELTEDNVMRFTLLDHISERDLSLLSSACTIQTAHVASVRDVEIHAEEDPRIK